MLTALAFVLAASPSYAQVKEGALPLERPGNAIAVLVGACNVEGGGVDGECLENTKALKDKVTDKKVALDLGSGYDALLSFGGRRGEQVRFVWGPLYDVRNGLALTVGKPLKLEPSGNVIVAKRPIDGTPVGELMDLDYQRLSSTGLLGIEIVGKFGKPWALSAGSKRAQGVSFELAGMRLYNARTGVTVFEAVGGLK